VLSWIVSVYFVPYLGTLLLKVPPHVPDMVAGAKSRTRCTTRRFT